MYIYVYICIYRCKVQVCKWARVCARTIACDRVRALTMRSYAACVRLRRALFVSPAIDGTRTGIVHRYMVHAWFYIHARPATPTNGSPMRARRTHAPACCVRAHARVRVRLGAHASAPTHASAFRRRRPRAASARRRSWVRRRSTRTSARGTPRVSSICPMYAPPFRPGRTPPPPGRARRVVDAARAVVRGGAADARACVCADMWAFACADVPVCRYSCA